MAITEFQRGICRLIAQNRVQQGDRYVAGGVALNTLLGTSRVSRDVDLFHDTREALAATWDADRKQLIAHNYGVDVRRERPTFVEAVVKRGEHEVVLEWVCDSAYRFFPLVEHPDFGLTLHPFDLATNKVLALVGRIEVRDWVDTIACSERLQHLGYLAWAACGKDPGYGPALLLAEGKRTARYSAAEVAELAFDGPVPDAGQLSMRWAEMLREASSIIDALPFQEIGKCVLSSRGGLFQGSGEDATRALTAREVVFHSGAIRGAMPSFVAG
jgi:Nucleotidyl transferase AbiEii toxin, Type IV TA system